MKEQNIDMFHLVVGCSALVGVILLVIGALTGRENLLFGGVFIIGAIIASIWLYKILHKG